jgi:hypothetical protein
VTLRFEDLRSGTIFTGRGAATSVKTTGISVMCFFGLDLVVGSDHASVTDVPHV